MNSFFKQLKKESDAIRLSTREREVMRLALEEAMRSRHLVKSPVHITPSPLLFFSHRLISSFAFVLVLAVVGSSTAYAAEAAVPGDVLYPVKVRVNEPLRAALALSSEAKAVWHTEAAERRMKEAEVLAARGTLTAEVKAGLEESFDTHATKVEAIVEAFGEEDPIVAADISTRLGSSIAAHSAVIARLGEGGENEESRGESRKLVRMLKERGKRIASAERGVSVKAERSASGEIAVRTFAKDAGTALTASITIRDSDAAIVARIERNASTTLEEAEAQFSAMKEKLDATTSQRTKTQISNIRGHIEKFREDDGKGSSEKEKIERALKDATTVKAFLEAQEKFEGHDLLPAFDVGENDDGDGDTEDEDIGTFPVAPTLPL